MREIDNPLFLQLFTENMSDGHCLSDCELGVLRDIKIENMGPALLEQSKYNMRQRERLLLKCMMIQWRSEREMNVFDLELKDDPIQATNCEWEF